MRRRDRGLSVSSQEGPVATTAVGAIGAASNNSSSSEGEKSQSNNSAAAKNSCICGVVSLLECVASGGPSTSQGGAEQRSTRRALRSKHREFNTRAQSAWGRGSSSSSGGGGNNATIGASKEKLLLSRSSTGGSCSMIGGNSSGGVQQQQQQQQRRRCYQPRHLPLHLNPNTRVTFAYELTSIAIVVDASPSLTATITSLNNNNMNSDSYCCFGEDEKSNKNMSSATTTEIMNDDGSCVPLDRLGTLLKTYLLGLVQPIDIPPVAVSGKGVAFGRWTPHLAVTVVAAYPPTSSGDEASAGLLVRDFRVTDEISALELVRQIERWALREVEGTIANRLCFGKQRDFVGDRGNNDGLSRLNSFSLPCADQLLFSSSKHTKTSLKELLAVGDAALATLPPEGRPIILIASDCQNLECTTTFEYLTATDRADVPLSVIDLSFRSCGGQDGHYAFDFRSSLTDSCQISGGIFLHRELLESCVKVKAGPTARQKRDHRSSVQPSPLLEEEQSRFHGDIHFSSKKRSLRPNALQWYTLFILSPFTPGAYAVSSTVSPCSSNALFQSSSISSTSLDIAKQSSSKSSAPSMDDSFGRSKDVPVVSLSTAQDRVMFSKYSIQPVRIKSLLMSRVLEGYRARRYGQTTEVSDKVSIHFVLRIAECDVVLHYEVSFVSDLTCSSEVMIICALQHANLLRSPPKTTKGLVSLARPNNWNCAH